jgi:hypothetical protein
VPKIAQVASQVGPAAESQVRAKVASIESDVASVGAEIRVGESVPEHKAVAAKIGPIVPKIAQVPSQIGPAAESQVLAKVAAIHSDVASVGAEVRVRKPRAAENPAMEPCCVTDVRASHMHAHRVPAAPACGKALGRHTQGSQNECGS